MIKKSVCKREHLWNTMINITVKCYFSSLIYRSIITLFRSTRLSRLPSISNAAADAVTRSSHRLRRVVSIRERYAAISERGHASRKNRTFLQKFLARENDSPCPLLCRRFPLHFSLSISINDIIVGRVCDIPEKSWRIIVCPSLPLLSLNIPSFFFPHLLTRLRFNELINTIERSRRRRNQPVYVSVKRTQHTLPSTWRVKTADVVTVFQIFVGARISPYAEERQLHRVNYRLKIKPIADAPDGATALPRFKMKSRGNDVFSKVRRNAPRYARPSQARKEQGGRRAHRVYNVGVAASCASGVPSAKR